MKHQAMDYYHTAAVRRYRSVLWPILILVLIEFRISLGNGPAGRIAWA
jgi:hypothetical protein